MDVPTRLKRLTVARFGAEGRAWLADLPAELEYLRGRYGIELDGPPFESASHSLVCPVRTRDGRCCVLKLHPSESAYVAELVAMRHWAGCLAAAQLQAWDERTRALLFERVVPGVALDGAGESDRTVQSVAACLRALWSHPGAGCPPPTMPPLSEHVKRLLLQARQRIRGGAGEGMLDESLVKAAVKVAGRLLAASPSPPLVLHGDPHGANLLQSDRGVIAVDPSATVGDPAFDVALWVVKGEGGRRLVWRSEALAVMAGLDARRVLAWCRVLALEEVVLCLMSELAPVEHCRELVRFVSDGRPPEERPQAD